MSASASAHFYLQPFPPHIPQIPQMSCEFLPSSSFDELTYPTESKYLSQGHSRHLSEGSLGNHMHLLPPDLAHYANIPQQPHYAEQLYYPQNYMAPMNMASIPPQHYDIPLSPRSIPPSQLQLPAQYQGDPRWNSVGYPQIPTGPQRASIGGDEVPYSLISPYDTYAPQQVNQPQVNGQTGVPLEQWSMAGSLDPITGMFYRSVEHPRLRTAQACEKCRARKAKCSGAHPACQRCVSRGLICEYAPERRMRGPNKPKNKPAPSTSSNSPPSSVSSRRSSVISLAPEAGPQEHEKSLPPDQANAGRLHSSSPSPLKASAASKSTAGSRLRKLRPPPLDLGTSSNIQRRIDAGLENDVRKSWSGDGEFMLTVRPPADVPMDVSSSDTLSLSLDSGMEDYPKGLVNELLPHASPLFSSRRRAYSLSGDSAPDSSASEMSTDLIPPPMISHTYGHGRSLSSGATYLHPIFVRDARHYDNIHHQRLSVPNMYYNSNGLGAPSPDFQNFGAEPGQPPSMSSSIEWNDVSFGVSGVQGGGTGQFSMHS